MELYVKSFRELTADELYEILRLRAQVFVVEQNCPYQDLDGRDRSAYHVYLRDEEGIEAYLRVTDRDPEHENVMIGRVIAVKRRQGLGTRIVNAGIETARERFSAGKIVVEAQTYAKGLYEKCGFIQTSEEFLEDGIPHVRMELG
jgi:ElaA protein